MERKQSYKHYLWIRIIIHEGLSLAVEPKQSEWEMTYSERILMVQKRDELFILSPKKPYTQSHHLLYIYIYNKYIVDLYI